MCVQNAGEVRQLTTSVWTVELSSLFTIIQNFKYNNNNNNNNNSLIIIIIIIIIKLELTRVIDRAVKFPDYYDAKVLIMNYF